MAKHLYPKGKDLSSGPSRFVKAVCSSIHLLLQHQGGETAGFIGQHAGQIDRLLEQ